MVAGEVPIHSKAAALISLDLGALIAVPNTAVSSKNACAACWRRSPACDESSEGVVLFIDEIHTSVNGDRAGADAGSVLKPALARGELRCMVPPPSRSTAERWKKIPC